PRLRWIGSRPGRLCMGVLVACMAALMIVPIPLTNTLPAMVIFLIGVGLSEEDGLFALFACILGVFAVLLYGALVFALISYGPEVIEHIKDWIRAFIRPS
ncbi:exopolysaccharide biosynthesis protein, partial [Arthrospira platensis SPKY1]|nr:exopolysaccharide biosynthesis protein [Arthrospira platensis SPKY1]